MSRKPAERPEQEQLTLGLGTAEEPRGPSGGEEAARRRATHVYGYVPRHAARQRSDEPVPRSRGSTSSVSC
jgi:hypothetical protein